MLTLRMYARTAWNDFYTGSPTVFQSKDYTSRQSLSYTNIYVLNCLFRSITSSNAGGALSLSSVTDLLIESTSFFSCKTSSYGGAVSLHNGQFVLDGVCGYDCCSSNTGSSYGQFTYIGVNNIASSKNYVNYSSMVRCVTENSNTYYTLCIFYGKNYCFSFNSSMNKCGYGINYLNPTTDSNNIAGSFSYCSITDNIATSNACIQLYRGNSKYEIKSCNILRNTQPSSSYGVISSWGNSIIQDCCILENTATYIFYVYSSSYTITLSNCTVDKTTKNGNVVTQKTATKSFILALNHMSTLNCASDYDSAGILTPVIQLPSSSKKQIRCYTGQKLFLQVP
jgi:hypothetical protein